MSIVTKEENGIGLGLDKAELALCLAFARLVTGVTVEAWEQKEKLELPEDIESPGELAGIITERLFGIGVEALADPERTAELLYSVKMEAEAQLRQKDNSMDSMYR